jgi:hypothetical protein
VKPEQPEHIDEMPEPYRELEACRSMTESNRIAIEDQHLLA